LEKITKKPDFIKGRIPYDFNTTKRELTKNMNKYSYDEICIGQIESFGVNITKDMQHMFLNISGDNNPMHIDDKYSQSIGFRESLVYGMLTASFYSTLVGTLLPGERCLFQEADIKFRKPVYVGDSLDITGECVEKNDTVKRLTIKAKIRNQNKELVSSAILRVGVLDG
jgi:3-hydroxybutyryl-CoA dehydratase